MGVALLDYTKARAAGHTQSGALIAGTTSAIPWRSPL
jgi:hypothetical protein